MAKSKYKITFAAVADDTTTLEYLQVELFAEDIEHAAKRAKMVVSSGRKIIKIVLQEETQNG